MTLSDLMRRSWNRRAQVDAKHFIHNARPLGEWDDTAFFETGRETVDRSLGVFLAMYPTRAKLRTILEIGCGVGRETVHLAQRFKSVIALDVSPEMLDRARDTVTAENVTFVLGNGVNLDVVGDQSVSFVYSAWTLQHIPDPDVQLDYLRETARVLRSEGWFYLQAYTDQADYARKAANWGKRAEVKQLLGWSEAARPEIESGEYPTWMCTALDVEQAKAVLAEGGLTVVYSEGEGSQSWQFGGKKA